MTRTITAAEARAISRAIDIQLPFGPNGDPYVWAGRSVREHGGGQVRCGSAFSFALLSVHGEHLGRCRTRAWASPLACPIG
jgi:hypothetical protein